MLDYCDLDTFRLHETGVASLTRVTGLTGVPGVRGDVFDRPENDGIIEPANQYLPSRAIVLEGEIWGASVDAAWASWNTLQQTVLAAMRTQKLLKWRRLGSTLDLQYTVRTSGDCTAVIDGGADGQFLHYQLNVRAADPLAYAQTSQSVSTGAPALATVGLPFPIPFPIPWSLSATGSGTVGVTNGGNAPTWPLFTIAGPINGPAIQNQTTGKSLYFDSLNLAAGDTLTIDTNPQTRSATVGGASKLGSLRYADSEFFTISANATEQVAFYGIGGGTTGVTTMTVSWRNAYIS